MNASVKNTRWRMAGMLGLLVLLLGILVACQAPAAAPAEEAAAPTEEHAEEVATEAPAEEAAAEAEATAPAEEEAAAEATAPAEEEAAAEATAEPAEEGAGEAMADDAVAMGGYLVTLTGGCGCHMNRDLGGLAGGNEFDTPLGKAYASNITPDEETGIGGWTAEDIAMVLHTGVDDEGRQLSPVMPYGRLSVLSDQEALAIGEYLLSLDPLSNAVTETVLSEAAPAFTAAVEPSAEPPTDPVARGEQLVTLANCGGCHTPKNEDGSAMEGMTLAGAPLRDEFAHNLTPDEETGIGTWSEEDIATYLRTGVEPDGKQAEGAMGQQIQRRFSTLTEGDAAAIAAYLKSLPAVVNAAPAE